MSSFNKPINTNLNYAAFLITAGPASTSKGRRDIVLVDNSKHCALHPFGGKLVENEEPVVGLIRELNEEFNNILTREDVYLVRQRTTEYKGEFWLEYFFATKNEYKRIHSGTKLILKEEKLIDTHVVPCGLTVNLLEGRLTEAAIYAYRLHVMLETEFYTKDFSMMNNYPMDVINFAKPEIANRKCIKTTNGARAGRTSFCSLDEKVNFDMQDFLDQLN